MDNFDFSGVFDGPLISAPDQWPAFDSVVMCSFSPDASPTPSPDAKRGALPSAAALAAMPIPPSRTSPRNKDPNHIPRPRNAFMLFRSAFAAAQKIASTIEHDNRHITRIIAHCWNRLSESEKQVWRDKAAAEKRQHAERYPNYRFSPTGRGNRRVKRNVRRNGVEDVKRCEQLAELVMAGKLGDELESAIKQIDEERLAAAHVVDAAKASTSAVEPSPRPRNSVRDVVPFRSPLLPPAEVTQQSLVGVAAAHPVEPVYPTPANLEYVFGCPAYYYYQPNGGEGGPPPRPVTPANQFQSVMNFVECSFAELEQSASDLSFFPWSPPDNFPYYAQ